MTNSGALRSVKLAHTAVWAFFVSCILGIPFVAWWGHYRTAALLVAIAALEVTVLVFGRMRCPLTTLATRYTEDRRPNFDIYLPEWLARHNQLIFGLLYVVGTLLALSLFVSALR